MSSLKPVTLRHVELADLDAVNAVIRSCVMGWDLPKRVKRLTISSYEYHPHDLDHFDLLMASMPRGEIAAVAAWEPATATDLPGDQKGILLHGLYVAPEYQHQGIGTRLLNAAIESARAQKVDGLLVKAQVDAVGFFQSWGFSHLPVGDENRDYLHRYWKSVTGAK